MKHLPGGRTSAVVLCPSCSHSFEVTFSEALGKEGRALRGEIVSLVEEIRSIRAAASDAARLSAQKEADMRSGHEAAIGAAEARLAHCEARLQEAHDRIMDLERRAAELGEGHNPDDTALIAALKAEAAALRKKILYYESPNSRRGMPSQLKGAAKKFDEEIARSCRRNGGTGAPIGPPIGRRGCSHRARPTRSPSSDPPAAAAAAARSPSSRSTSPASCTASSRTARTSCAPRCCASTTSSATAAGR